VSTFFFFFFFFFWVLQKPHIHDAPPVPPTITTHAPPPLSSRMLALGIDIGGTSVKTALLRDGQTIATGQSPPYSRPNADQLRAALAHAAPLPAMPRPDAVGLCAPGLFDPASGTITLAANLPGIVGLPLVTLAHAIAPDLPAPRIVTDAHAAAFDLWHEERRNEQLSGRLLALSLGTGVGACVLDNGEPLLVSGRSPGHLGQIDVTVHEPAPVAPDGTRGSLEAYLGLHALRARYAAPDHQLPARIQPGEPPFTALVRALRIATAIYRPDHIRLLGGVGVRLASQVHVLRSAVQDALTPLARLGWTLRAGTSDFHAACGAARLASHPIGR
jgi:predicted NBD/HSP70 family sugar kinase